MWPTIGDEVTRVQSSAAPSDGLSSIAKVLPLPHRAVRPYTLGEAVAELGAYAQAVGSSNWNRNHAKQNRASLRSEISAQSEVPGQRLSALIASVLDLLRDDTDPEAVVAAAAGFNEAWHSEVAVAAAFRDLCDAAKVPGATSPALRNLSAIIASQVGPAAHGAFSLLSQAADVLVDTEEELGRWRDAPLPSPLTEVHRVQMATDVLVAPPAGRIVVWTAYYRAIVSRMREAAGPLTFLQADWALPNAFDVEVHDFPERAELREIRNDVRWLDTLHVESLKPENRVALVRVDLGERQVAGAVDEALRRIEAVLSVAVHAGGSSWRNAGVTAVLLDGDVRGSSRGLNLRESPALDDDSYGMGATAEIISTIADELGIALTKGPMPERLVEALISLREARMTDHRDVLFNGARRVTPRVATALEDHAMELIASVLGVGAERLADALERRETLFQADRRIAGQLFAPFDEAWSREHSEVRQQLEEEISDYNSGQLEVSIEKVVALQAQIRTLTMSDLQRADFEDALAICTDPDRERQFLGEIWRTARLLRARHRRVRNAVNHGLPLNEITLNSIRDYAKHTSSTALNVALTWFKNGGPGGALLQQEENIWADRTKRMDNGVSWAAAATSTEEA